MPIPPESGRATPRPCPTCRRKLRPATAARRYWPFCSRRCAEIDLGRWLGEVYRVPGAEPPEEADLSEDDPAADEQ